MKSALQYFSYVLWLPLLLVILSIAEGCATIPETFDERVAVAYATNTEIRTTAAAALNAGQLSHEQGYTILRLTDQVRDLLDDASAGNERGLDLAIEILANLQEYFQ